MPQLPSEAFINVRGASGLDTCYTTVTQWSDTDSPPRGDLIPAGVHREVLLELFQSGETFSSVYSVGHIIGEGGFGKVFQATHRVLGVSRAVKRIKKTNSRVELRKNEVTSLLACDHPHIIKLCEYFDEEHFLYLVFEMCKGPDLLTCIQQEKTGRLSEHAASVALRHILKALQCCHAHYRGHYDIKPENFMYVSKELHDLMMIDFGMSSAFDQQRRRKIKGTPAYMAPEFFDGIYGPEGDIWSCGVVLFVMLTGRPFLDHVPPDLLKREAKSRSVVRQRLKSAAEEFNLSEVAQDLLNSMLQHDRHARPTVREALHHPFNLKSYEYEQPENVKFNEALAFRCQLLDIFRVVAREPVLKRMARLAMAHASDLVFHGLVAQRFLFRMLDRHGYGEISITVLENDLLARGVELPEDLGDLFEAIDLFHDGYVGYLAFLAIMLPQSLRSNIDLSRVAFDILDRGKDGYIDCEDLVAVFQERQGREDCKSILAEVCPEDKPMSWDMFLNMLGGGEVLVV